MDLNFLFALVFQIGLIALLILAFRKSTPSDAPAQSKPINPDSSQSQNLSDTNN